MLRHVMLCYVCRERESTSIRKKKSGGSDKEVADPAQRVFRAGSEGKMGRKPMGFLHF